MRVNQAQPTASRKSYWHMHTNQLTGQCWPHPKHRSLLVTNCANSSIKERRSLECHSTHPRRGSTSQTVATRYLGDVLRTVPAIRRPTSVSPGKRGDPAEQRLCQVPAKMVDIFSRTFQQLTRPPPVYAIVLLLPIDSGPFGASLGLTEGNSHRRYRLLQ